MHLPRASGVLLHPTSLPGPDGIGDLGDEAFRFVDFLARAGQTIWQVLPLTPTVIGDSPYASSSAFAGNPLLISLARIVSMGDPPDRNAMHRGEPVNFDLVGRHKIGRLRELFHLLRHDVEFDSRFRVFREQNAHWLTDYALFTSIKELHNGAPWTQWPEHLRHYPSATLDVYRDEHAESIHFHEFVQSVFSEQWAVLRAYANEHGVRIMGDVPIFVAHDSADVWSHPHLFHLDEHGELTAAAGVPPDYFSPTGQLWGNPLYDFAAMRAEGYQWWIDRFRRMFEQVDIVRIDHFRGFAAHWSIPAGADTAINGKWTRAPGTELLYALRQALGDLPIVAEDLGTITPDVEVLRDTYDLPGMKVLQFAFGDTPANPYLPHNLTRNCVVYTGTHDNDTTVGWYRTLEKNALHNVHSYIGTNGHDIAWDLIRLALGSVADTAIIPLQDVLSLDGGSRMNTPGKPEGNWSWRVHPEQVTEALGERLREATRQFNRLPKSAVLSAAELREVDETARALAAYYADLDG